MAFWEAYSPDQVDEIKEESSKSELVAEGTDNKEAEKIANSTNRGWDKVVDMDTTTTETKETDETSEEDAEENSLEMFNWNKDLAKNEAEKIIKENLPDAINHLNEQEKQKFANSIEEWIAESGVDLPIETVPENRWESLKNYVKVANNKDLLTPDQRKALDDAENSAVKNMEEETKEKVLSNIVNNSIPWELWEPDGGRNPEPNQPWWSNQEWEPNQPWGWLD